MIVYDANRVNIANDELVKGDAHEDQKKRCLTVTEIIESEKSFLKNMTSAIEVPILDQLYNFLFAILIHYDSSITTILPKMASLRCLRTKLK